MKLSSRLAVIIGTFVLAVTCATAQSTGFYRIVSTQETYIVSLDTSGLMVWSNSVPNAPCQIELKRVVDGVWTNNFPMSPLRTNGLLLQRRVPMHSLLQQWIVAFQPSVTLEEAEALFDANKVVWRLLSWNSLRLTVIAVPQGRSISAIQSSPLVRYVEPDHVIVIY